MCEVNVWRGVAQLVLGGGCWEVGGVCVWGSECGFGEVCVGVGGGCECGKVGVRVERWCECGCGEVVGVG